MKNYLKPDFKVFLMSNEDLLAEVSAQDYYESDIFNDSWNGNNY